MEITQTNDFELVAKLNKPVHDLHCSLYPNYFNEYDYVEIKDVFKKMMGIETFIFLLLKEDKVGIGYAWIEIRDYQVNPFKKPYKSIYVHQINIMESKRKKGYGTILMRHIYDIARDKGINLVELDYWVENKIAKDFYEKHDFVRYRDFVYKQL